MKRSERKPKRRPPTARLIRARWRPVAPIPKEPGFAELIRRIATMPEGTRAAIEAFLALAPDTKSVSADLDSRGVLTLSSGEAARAIALAHYVAAQDDDQPRLPN